MLRGDVPRPQTAADDAEEVVAQLAGEPAQPAGPHAERGHDRGRPGRGRRVRGADVRRGRGSDRHCRGCHGHGHGHEGGVRGGRRGEWMVTVTMVAMVGHNDSAMILNYPGRACICAGLYVGLPLY